MASYLPFPVTVWLWAAFAAATILYAVAAQWVAVGKGPAWARSAPLILLLAALVPIGAFELLVLFATEAVTIVAGTRCGGVALRTITGDLTFDGLMRRRRERGAACARGEGSDAPRGRTLRFSLGDLLGWLAVAAAVLAILRHLPTGPAWSVQTVGGGAAIPALVGIGIVLGAFAVVVIGLIRACARRWERYAGREDRGPSRWPKQIGRAAAISLTVSMFLPLVAMYRALLPPPMPPAVVLPNPNGFDRLTKLGRLFNWSAISSQDVEAASEAACRQFLQDNTAAFTQLREDLQLPSRVPLT